jgi:hypothetical protein
MASGSARRRRVSVGCSSVSQPNNTMPSAREDYLLRMIQQLGEVLRRLRARLIGKVDATEVAGIEREAGQAITTLLGPQAPVLQQLDVTSAVRTVGDRDRVAMWVAFLRVQSEAQRASGRIDAADRLAARAAALEQAARAAWPQTESTNA